MLVKKDHGVVLSNPLLPLQLKAMYSDEIACSTCSASGAATACAVTTPILWECPAYKVVHTRCFSCLTAAEPLAVLVTAGCLLVLQSFACLSKKQVIKDLLLWQDGLKLAGRPARAKRTSPNRPCSRRALFHSSAAAEQRSTPQKVRQHSYPRQAHVAVQQLCWPANCTARPSCCAKCTA